MAEQKKTQHVLSVQQAKEGGTKRATLPQNIQKLLLNGITKKTRI